MNDTTKQKRRRTKYHTIEIRLGDLGGDGHCRTSNQLIRSSLNHLDLKAAFALGSKTLGFDLTDLCGDYEDNVIPADAASILVKAGLLNADELSESDATCPVYADTFADLYLAVCKLGNPEFKFKMFDPPSIDIGGYGLFYP